VKRPRGLGPGRPRRQPSGTGNSDHSVSKGDGASANWGRGLPHFKREPGVGRVGGGGGQCTRRQPWWMGGSPQGSSQEGKKARPKLSREWGKWQDCLYPKDHLGGAGNLPGCIHAAKAPLSEAPAPEQCPEACRYVTRSQWRRYQKRVARPKVAGRWGGADTLQGGSVQYCIHGAAMAAFRSSH
jgi:hypothetical protein